MTEVSLGTHSRVCAVVVARIGDTLLVTPSLRSLRAATGHLKVLVHPHRTAVLENLDFIDELGTITKRSAWLRGRMSGARYDLAVCWGRDDQLLRYCLRVAKRTVAFAYPEFDSVRAKELECVPIPPDKSMHAVAERHLLADAAGVHCADFRLAYSVTDLEFRAAQSWLRKHAGSAAPLIGMQPFSFPTKAHRDWPLDRFVTLAGQIVEKHPSAHFIILGDEVAARRADELAGTFPGRFAVAAGSLTLRESAALMKALDLYIGVDTGPTHIAGALQVPMVALYHSRYPGSNLMPLGHPLCAVLQADGPTMESISVASVCSAALGILEAASPRSWKAGL
jgi:heptosyltransferase-3